MPEAPYVQHRSGRDGAGARRRRPGVGQREDDGRDRADGCAAPPRDRGGAVQGRARLHRPGLPHPRGRAAGPEPGSGAGRRAPDRPAVPTRGGGRGGGRRRGRDGPVRRAAGRRARLDRARRRAAGGAGRAGRRLPGAVAQRRGAVARVPVVRPRDAGRRGGAQPGRQRAARGRAARRLRRGRAPGARRAAAAGGAGRAVAAPRAGDGGRARRRGDGGGRRRWPSWWRRTSTSTRWSAWPSRSPRGRPGTRRPSSPRPRPMHRTGRSVR